MEMNFATDRSNHKHSGEMGPVLSALAEINVQLRHILQISKSAIQGLEMRGQVADPFEEIELESRKQSILVNMSRMDAALGNLDQEISALLGNGRHGMSSRKIRSRSSIDRKLEGDADNLRVASESRCPPF